MKKSFFITLTLTGVLLIAMGLAIALGGRPWGYILTGVGLIGLLAGSAGIWIRKRYHG